MESLMQLLGSASFNAFWVSYLLLPASSHPPVRQLTIQYSSWGEIGLFGSILQSWGRWVLIHTLPMGGIMDREGLLGTELCHLGKGWRERSPTIPLTLSNVSKHIYIFCPAVCCNLSAGNLDLHEGSLVHGWLSKTVFSKGFWTMAERG